MSRPVSDRCVARRFSHLREGRLLDWTALWLALEARCVPNKHWRHQMAESLAPFHEQAEEVGMFLLEDRARDADRRDDERPAERPPQNID